jgi:ATP-dependent RNA circularization protein (DNA/RNA ligase family)
MSEFFRFTRTAHLAWLGSGVPRDDKVLSPAEVQALLSDEVIVEEKLDGANLGVSLDESGKLRLQNRGQYVTPPYHGQFARATSWIARHQHCLAPALGETLILFGEWCAARHSIAYEHLPDWLLAFDIYDREVGRFWCTARRDSWAERFEIRTVPVLFRHRTTFAVLKELVLTEASRFGAPKLEGVVIRRDGKQFLEERAKLVRPDFTQSIGEHWRHKPIEWNVVTPAPCA